MLSRLLDAPPPGLPTRVELSAVSIALPRWLDGRVVWRLSYGLVGLCGGLVVLQVPRLTLVSLLGMALLGGGGLWVFVLGWGTILGLLVRRSGLRSTALDTEPPGLLFWIVFGPAVFGVLVLLPLLVDAALGLGLGALPPLPGFVGMLGLLVLLLALVVLPALRQHRLRLAGAYLTVASRWRTRRWPLETLQVSEAGGLHINGERLPSAAVLTPEEQRWLASVIGAASAQHRAALEATGHDLRVPAAVPDALRALRAPR